MCGCEIVWVVSGCECVRYESGYHLLHLESLCDILSVKLFGARWCVYCPGTYKLYAYISVWSCTHLQTEIRHKNRYAYMPISSPYVLEENKHFYHVKFTIKIRVHSLSLSLSVSIGLVHAYRLICISYTYMHVQCQQNFMTCHVCVCALMCWV